MGEESETAGVLEGVESALHHETFSF